MYLVLECGKCGHRLYIQVNKYVNLLKTLGNISERYDCPECGEEPYENWILIGTAENFPGDEENEEDEEKEKEE